MKVLNVCFDDFANYSYDNAMALRAVGIDAHSIKRVKHVFGYPNQSKIVSTGAMVDLIRKADVIQIMHSDEQALRICINLKKKNVFVYHTGTKYRVNPARMNELFNSHVKAAFTDQTEFMGTGMKNEQYIAGAVDIKNVVWNQIKSPYVIAHYPSNPVVKGTDKIVEMMKKVKGSFTFKYSKTKVNATAQSLRMKDCDIYIELFKPELNGRPYGCYGVTAFEAAALGKIVITNNIRPDVYARAYGKCPFIIANTEMEFKKKLTNLINLSPDYILNMQTDTYAWVINTHSYKATGQRIKTLLNI